jgi:glycyl-tRNA synthetase beta chain
VDAVFALGDDDLVRIVRGSRRWAPLATDDGANLLAGGWGLQHPEGRGQEGRCPDRMVQTGLANQPEAETRLAFAADAARTAVDAAWIPRISAAAMTALAALQRLWTPFTDVLVNSDRLPSATTPGTAGQVRRDGARRRLRSGGGVGAPRQQARREA